MKKSTTKRALLMSVLSMFLCFTMLIGTTFAWFTDEVESGVNTIVAGNLDVELYNGLDDTAAQVEDTTVLFDGIKLWEPGAVVYENLTVANKGTLALKYALSVQIAKVQGSVNLADVLKVAVVEGITTTDRAEVLNMASGKWQDFESFVETGKLYPDGYVDPNGATGPFDQTKTYGIVIWWEPSDKDNDYNMKEGAEQLKLTIGVNLFATQLEGEIDSFGDDYDEGAPIVTPPADVPATGGMVVNDLVSGVNVTVPGKVVEKLAENSITSVSVAVSAPVADTTAKTVTFANVALVDENGQEIDMEAIGITDNVTVKLPVADVFADGVEVAVYHDDEFITFATVVDGYITYEVAHFCEVSVKDLATVAEKENINLNVTPNEENVLTIDNAMQFLAFAKAVNAGDTYAGKTVILANDIDLAGISWTPIGNASVAFKGTFDGDGKVISNLVVLLDGQSNVGLFGNTHNGEIKNVTVNNAKVAGRLNVGVVAGQPYTSKYTNIKVTGHVEVDGMAYVGAVGGKNAYANWDNITVDVDEDSYVKADSVENGVAYRTYVGGVIGFMGEGAHTVSNVTSNIDVYGSTCDVGGVVGIAHYQNSFVNIACSGDVYVTNASEAADAEEMGGIAGVWMNSTVGAVTFTNCTFTGKLSANVAADLSNNTITGKAYSSTSAGTLIIDGVEFAAVSTADMLVEALGNGKNVIFVSDIKINPANMSNAYGKTGINVKNGQTIDGAGYTLDIKGAGGTWDSGINTTGGLIKNIKVTGSFRGIFINHNSDHSEPVVLENVILDGTTYTISCDQGKNQGLVATNCTFNGWTSFAGTLGNAKFVDCTFGYGAGYAFARPYAPTEFVGCDFEAGYKMDPRAAVTFENCTIAGASLTNDNLATLVTSRIENASVK